MFNFQDLLISKPKDSFRKTVQQNYDESLLSKVRLPGKAVLTHKTEK